MCTLLRWGNFCWEKKILLKETPETDLDTDDLPSSCEFWLLLPQGNPSAHSDVLAIFLVVLIGLGLQLFFLLKKKKSF